jgi:hypothetical protein
VIDLYIAVATIGSLALIIGLFSAHGVTARPMTALYRNAGRRTAWRVTPSAPDGLVYGHPPCMGCREASSGTDTANTWEGRAR